MRQWDSTAKICPLPEWAAEVGGGCPFPFSRMPAYADSFLLQLRVTCNISAIDNHSQEAMRRSLAALLFVLVVVPQAQAESSFVLSIRDHRFEPTEFEVPAGEKIVLTVKNLDPTPEEFESTDMRREKVVAGGQEITVYLGPLRPGRYEFFGDFHPDTARGHVVAK